MHLSQKITRRISKAQQTQLGREPQEHAIAPDNTPKETPNQLHSTQQVELEASQIQEPKQPQVQVTIHDSTPEQAQKDRCQLLSIQPASSEASQTQQPLYQLHSTQQEESEASQTQQPKEPQVPVSIHNSTPKVAQSVWCQLHSTQKASPIQQPIKPQVHVMIPDSTPEQAQKAHCQLHSTKQVTSEAPQMQQPKQPQVQVTIPDSTPEQAQKDHCQMHSTQQVTSEASQIQQPKQPQVQVTIPDSTPKESQNALHQLHSTQEETSPTQEPVQPQVHHIFIPDSTPKQALYQRHLTQLLAESRSTELPRTQPQRPAVTMTNRTQDKNVQLLQQNQKTLQELKEAVASLEAAFQQLQNQQQNQSRQLNPAQRQDVTSSLTTQQHPHTRALPMQPMMMEPHQQSALPPAVEDIQTRLQELTRSMTGLRPNVLGETHVQQVWPHHRCLPPSIPSEKLVNSAIPLPCRATSSPIPASTLHYHAQTASKPIHKGIGPQHTATKEYHRQSGSGHVNRPRQQQTTFNSGFPGNVCREVPYAIPSILPFTEYGERLQHSGQTYVKETLSVRPTESSYEGGYMSDGVWRSHKDQIVPNVEISHSLHSTPEINVQRPRREEPTLSKSQTEEGQNGNKESEQQNCTLEYQRKSLLEGQQQQNYQQAADRHEYRENIQMPEEGHDDEILTQPSNQMDQCPQDVETFQTHASQEHFEKETEMQCQKESLKEIESQQLNNEQEADRHEYQEHAQLSEEAHGSLVVTQNLAHIEQCPKDKETVQTSETGQEHNKKEGEAQSQMESLEDPEGKRQNNEQKTDKYQEQPQLPGKSHDSSMVTQQSDNLESFQTCAIQEQIHIKKEGETDYQKKSLEECERLSNQREANNNEQPLQPEGGHGGPMVPQYPERVDQRQQETLQAHTGQKHIKKDGELQCRNKSLEEPEGQEQSNQQEADKQEGQEQTQLSEETNCDPVVTQHSDNLEQLPEDPCQRQTEQEEHRKERETEASDGQQQDQEGPRRYPLRKRRRPNENPSKSDPEERSASKQLRRVIATESQNGKSRESKANHTKEVLKTTKWSMIKKPWTHLSQAQHDRLEAVFQVWRNRRVEKTLIFQLSEELKLPERQVKMWFYNRKQQEARSQESLVEDTPDVFKCSTSLFDAGCLLDPLAALRTNPRQLSVEDCAVVVQHLQTQLNAIINP